MFYIKEEYIDIFRDSLHRNIYTTLFQWIKKVQDNNNHEKMITHFSDIENHVIRLSQNL